MKLEHFRLKLLEKERECQSGLAAFEKEARAGGMSEVRDSIDQAGVSEGTSEALDEGTIVSRTLEAVQDALRRIETGAYGKCTLCGRKIEPARLEAVPWAAYCLEDQEKQDKADPRMHAGTTL